MTRTVSIFLNDNLARTDSIEVTIEPWMDETDQNIAATQEVAIWCSDSGHGYDDVYWQWGEVHILGTKTGRYTGG